MGSGGCGSGLRVPPPQCRPSGGDDVTGKDLATPSQCCSWINPAALSQPSSAVPCTSEQGSLRGLWDWEQLGPTSAELQNICVEKDGYPGHQQEEKGLKKCGENLGNWSKGAHGCNEEGGCREMSHQLPSWSPGTWSLRLSSRTALVQGSQLPGCALLPLQPSIPLLSMPLCWGTQTLSHPNFTFQPCCKPSGSPSSDLPSCKPGMNSFPSCPRWIQAFRKTSKGKAAPGSPICNLLLSQPAAPCPCGPALCPDLAGLLQQGTNLRNVAQGGVDADSCLGAGRDTHHVLGHPSPAYWTPLASSVPLKVGLEMEFWGELSLFK